MPTNLFRHRDLQPLNPVTDTLTVNDLHLSSCGMLPVHEALTTGHLLPADLAMVPCAFNAQVLWGALMCRSIPEAPWKGVQIGLGRSSGSLNDWR
jgi:hypothetical protein